MSEFSKRVLDKLVKEFPKIGVKQMPVVKRGVLLAEQEAKKEKVDYKIENEQLLGENKTLKLYIRKELDSIRKCWFDKFVKCRQENKKLRERLGGEQ